jgi:hypothetical protein
MVAQMESIVPSAVPRNIAVITPTAFAPRSSNAEVGSPEWVTVGRVIPFFGLLSGLAYVGHSVWLFEGQASEIEPGCREADILIVDSEVAPRLSADSLERARKSMRGAGIFIHDRATYKLKPLAPVTQTGASWEFVFENVRRNTKRGERPQIVLVQPDRSLLGLPCLPLASMKPDQLAQAYRIVPEGTSRNVAVIAPTALVADPSDSAVSPAIAQLRAAGRTIPFFGLLLNLASVGNPLWIFDGAAEAVTFGCAQADLLFVDSALAGKLTTKTIDDAAKVMRSANIVVYDRGSRKTAFLRQVGPSQDKLEFRD